VRAPIAKGPKTGVNISTAFVISRDILGVYLECEIQTCTGAYVAPWKRAPHGIEEALVGRGIEVKIPKGSVGFTL